MAARSIQPTGFRFCESCFCSTCGSGVFAVEELQRIRDTAGLLIDDRCRVMCPTCGKGRLNLYPHAEWSRVCDKCRDAGHVAIPPMATTRGTGHETSPTFAALVRRIGDLIRESAEKGKGA